MNLSRQAALSSARYVYTTLAERARAASDDPTLVDDIFLAWRDRLDSLNSFRTDPVLRDETNDAVSALMAAVLRTPDEDTDALLRWLDVFPNMVAELFPPSESTFRMEPMPQAELDNEEAPEETGSFALVA